MWYTDSLCVLFVFALCCVPNVARVSELFVLISRSLSCHVYYVMHMVYWQAIRFVCLRFVWFVCCRCLWIVRSDFPFTFPSHILHNVHGILTGYTTTNVTSVYSVCIHMFSTVFTVKLYWSRYCYCCCLPLF